MTLSECKKNQFYTISGFQGQMDGVLRRFLELGFAVGQRVKIVSTSLQKKVFLIEIRGYVLSVRAELLKKISCEDTHAMNK